MEEEKQERWIGEISLWNLCWFLVTPALPDGAVMPNYGLANSSTFLSVVHHSPTMTDRPIVPSETHKCQNEAWDEVASEVDNIVEAFIKTLNNLAERHGWYISLLSFGVVVSLSPSFFHSKLSYMDDLAGIACEKKAKKGHTGPWVAFCGLKLNTENKGESLLSSVTSTLLTVILCFLQTNPRAWWQHFGSFLR